MFRREQGGTEKLVISGTSQKQVFGGIKMKETKECYEFSGQKVCKVCGCKDNSCECHTELEGKRDKPL